MIYAGTWALCRQKGCEAPRCFSRRRPRKFQKEQQESHIHLGRREQHLLSGEENRNRQHLKNSVTAHQDTVPVLKDLAMCPHVLALLFQDETASSETGSSTESGFTLQPTRGQSLETAPSDLLLKEETGGGSCSHWGFQGTKPGVLFRMETVPAAASQGGGGLWLLVKHTKLTESSFKTYQCSGNDVTKTKASLFLKVTRSKQGFVSFPALT